MSEQIPTNKPERKELLDDNARKFLVDAIDSRFLTEHNPSSFTLTTDWLETGEANEKKLAHKQFDNGDIQILLIAKTTKGGNRTSEKELIIDEKYKQLLPLSMLRLEKKRYEFKYTQGDVDFEIKYDEFAKQKLCMLEVDASNEEERNAFNPDDFPDELTEVTGNLRYYGYRIGQKLGA